MKKPNQLLVTANSTITILKTKRTTLVVLAPQDAYLIHDYYLQNKNRLAPFEPLREKAFYNLESWYDTICTSYTSYQNGTGLNVVALDKTTGKMIASCNFTGIMMGSFRACYMGFSVAENHEGTGLMFEVAQSGIFYIFTKYELHRIMSNHLPENTKSEKLLQRLGFEIEGYAKSYLKINGIWQDHVLTSLINTTIV